MANGVDDLAALAADALNVTVSAANETANALDAASLSANGLTDTVHAAITPENATIDDAAVASEGVNDTTME